MAENGVVKEQLTPEMIDAGAALTQSLDHLGLPVQAAFWLFDAEINEWRLVIASSDAATKGPRAVYRSIREAIDQLGASVNAVPFSAIRVVEPGSELVRLLGSAVRTGSGIGRIRFQKNVINGHFIDDALIYRTAG